MVVAQVQMALILENWRRYFPEPIRRFGERCDLTLQQGPHKNDFCANLKFRERLGLLPPKLVFSLCDLFRNKYKTFKHRRFFLRSDTCPTFVGR